MIINLPENLESSILAAVQNGQFASVDDAMAEAADKMGADVCRWLYCRTNPAANINFGYGPADEIRSAFVLKLWNVYAFFCNYARLDGFDPAATPVPVDDRPDIDRWILSDLQLLVNMANHSFLSFNVMAFCLDAEKLVDDKLSNWYVRRNRRRFWKGDKGLVPDLASRVAGSSDIFGHRGRRPWASINFVTAHDGFTLYDLLSYERKRNWANGQNNQDGMDDNYSWNCGHEGEEGASAEVLALRRKQVKNLCCLLLLSNGIPMLRAGDEFLDRPNRCLHVAELRVDDARLARQIGEIGHAEHPHDPAARCAQAWVRRP